MHYTVYYTILNINRINTKKGKILRYIFFEFFSSSKYNWVRHMTYMYKYIMQEY